MSIIIEVTTTCSSQEAARQLAEQLVAARLAACVHVSGPIESVYRWEGEVRCEVEWSCVAKSMPRVQESLVKFVQRQHSYEVPQIIIAQCTASPQYAQWVDQEVVPAASAE